MAAQRAIYSMQTAALANIARTRGELTRFACRFFISFQHKESLVGALPKKKVSNHRQGNRRQHHRVKLPQLKVCPQCRQARLSHHACPNCGTYRGRQVLPVKTARAAE
jgi:large subunit ribosomal protein L32